DGPIRQGGRGHPRPCGAACLPASCATRWAGYGSWNPRGAVIGYLTEPDRSGAFRLAQGAQELVGIARRDEPLAHLLPADESRAPAERLDVRACGGFRTDEHEEQPDRLAVQCVEVHGLPGESGRHAQVRDRGRLAVRDRDAVADPGGKDGLAFHDGAEHVLRVIYAVLARDEVDELLEHVVLRTRFQRNTDPFDRKQVRQEQRRLESSAVGGSSIARNCRKLTLEEWGIKHTSELQSRENLVCRLLLAKKKRCNES